MGWYAWLGLGFVLGCVIGFIFFRIMERKKALPVSGTLVCNDTIDGEAELFLQVPDIQTVKQAEKVLFEVRHV